MDRAAEDRAHEDPQEPREVAELRGKHGAHEGSGTGDGREMMPEHDPAVGPDKILPVGVGLRGSGPQFVDREHPGHEPGRVEPVGDREHARGGNDHPERAHLLATGPGKDGDARRAEGGNGRP